MLFLKCFKCVLLFYFYSFLVGWVLLLFLFIDEESEILDGVIVKDDLFSKSCSYVLIRW